MAIVTAGLRLGEPQQLDGRWPAEWAVRYCDFRSLLAERREHFELCRGEQHRVQLGPASFNFSILGSELIVSGTGIQQHNSVLQTFVAAGNGGQIVFNNTSTAGHATIISAGDDLMAPGAAELSSMIHRLPKALSWSLMEVCYADRSGGIIFNDMSTGGTARVQVSRGFPSKAPNGYLDISGHQSGVTIGSIEGDGDIFLGANDLTVGTNNINTVFSGFLIGGSGSLAKVGNGVLTLQTNYCIGDTIGLILVKRLNYQARLYRRLRT